MSTIELGPDDCAIVLRHTHAEGHFAQNTCEKNELHNFFLSAVIWAMAENPEAFDGLMELFDKHVKNQPDTSAN